MCFWPESGSIKLVFPSLNFNKVSPEMEENSQELPDFALGIEFLAPEGRAQAVKTSRRVLQF